MPNPSRITIGIISDTHNYLDPQIPKLFAGVEHILHGGDIGQTRIVLELEQIAPVTAVLGNTDDPGLHFRETEVVQLGGRRFLVHHIVNPRNLTESLTERIARERPDVVVFGHTHQPFCQTIEGTLFFNPGYAGKQRFNLSRSVALLYCDEKGIRTEYVAL
jgi:putative phosphoesterase